MSTSTPFDSNNINSLDHFYDNSSYLTYDHYLNDNTSGSYSIDDYITYQGVSPSSEEFIMGSPNGSPLGEDQGYYFDASSSGTQGGRAGDVYDMQGGYGRTFGASGVELVPTSGITLEPVASGYGMQGSGYHAQYYSGQDQGDQYGERGQRDFTNIEDIDFTLQEAIAYERDGAVPLRKKRKMSTSEDDVSFVKLDRETLLSVTYEELENYIERLKTQRPLTVSENEVVKKQLRSVRNREYASQNRKKKKQDIEKLENELLIERDARKKAEENLAVARMQIQYLQRENNLMQQLLNQVQANAANPTPATPNYAVQGGVFLMIFLFSFGFIFNFIDDPFDLDAAQGVDQWHPRTMLSYLEQMDNWYSKSISKILRAFTRDNDTEQGPQIYTMDDVLEKEYPNTSEDLCMKNTIEYLSPWTSVAC
eukprot:TRINITY_DN346_c1_g1_i1.p1 TRINITY_DN346_c1_g1~~TRINITY_DN346_c1_g1_i1.p1  ORF type:complete len:474 (-),score=94.16 TRINITY_DN346_c1_g1_i1:77-1345(-)